jgi:ATP-dependent RNA helicase RhlE
VITPTRELCIQVEESVRTYGRHLGIRSTTIFGGVGMGNQLDALKQGPRIVVATPGRLLDHVSQRSIDLSTVSFVVLDEADRMLDMGFIHDMKKVFAILPRKRQTLLFSATFSPEIRKLASNFLTDPVSVEVAPRNATADLVSQSVFRVDKDQKRHVLAHLVRTRGWTQVLVFTRTKHGANRLAEQLQRDGISADAIHGNKSQNARQRALKRFKEGEIVALVATDVAARGIDIELLPIVVNYDLPNVPEDYVHRIGRTARAGASGEAVSLVTGEDRPLLADIEKLMRRQVPVGNLEGYVPVALAPGAPRDDEDDRPPLDRNRGGRGQGRGAGRGQSGQGQGQRGQGRGGAPASRSAERPASAAPRSSGQPTARADQPRSEQTPVRNEQSRAGQPRSGAPRPGQARDGQRRDGPSRSGQPARSTGAQRRDAPRRPGADAAESSGRPAWFDRWKAEKDAERQS